MRKKGWIFQDYFWQYASEQHLKGKDITRESLPQIAHTAATEYLAVVQKIAAR